MGYKREILKRIKYRDLERGKEDSEYRSELVEQYMPLLMELGRVEDLDRYKIREVLESKLGPMGVMLLAELALNAKKERVRADCSRDLAYMGGFKPVERSQNLDVHLMAEAEVDSLLRSVLDELGFTETKLGGEEATLALGPGEETDKSK